MYHFIIVYLKNKIINTRTKSLAYVRGCHSWLFMFESKSLSRIRLVMKERFRMTGREKSRQGFFSRSLYRYRPPLCRPFERRTRSDTETHARFRKCALPSIARLCNFRNYSIKIERRDQSTLVFTFSTILAKMFRQIFEFNSTSARIIYRDINRIQRDTPNVILIEVIYF